MPRDSKNFSRGKIKNHANCEKLARKDSSLRAVSTELGADAEDRTADFDVLDQRLFVLDAKSWNAFKEALDAPSHENKALEMLLARKPAWEKRPFS